jgi:hypothetical protein
VNLGVFHLEDKEEEEEEEEEEESKDEEYNNESVEEGVLFAALNSPDQPERMMPANKNQFLNRELSPDKEHKIHFAKNELQNIKNGGCLTSGDICNYFDYLGGQDKQLCKNFTDRKASLFHSTSFITFNSDGTCKYLKKNQNSKIDISKTRNIFIPIHKGNHFTCVVIFLKEKRISYYNSLLATNRTRTACVHKKKQQEKILGVVMQYLQDEFKKNDYDLIDQKSWSLKTMCNVPQQDNTKDCGIFVCLYCNFILNDCALDFNQNNIRCGVWNKKIVLSILSINKNDNNDSNPVIASHLTWTKETEKYVKMPDFNVSKICDENSGCHYECDDNCDGKDKCNNKRIQQNQWKNVVERDSGNPNKGFGQFLEEGCKKDDFIIEYMGKVTKKHGGNYSMKINPPPESKGKRDTVYINAKIDGGLAKYINHSCNPNCKLIQWYVEGLPHLRFFARREIKRGTELTFNYNWIMGRGKRTECFCGGENCDGYVEK